ncbi:MAG: hypothetical protein ABIX01_09990 [Chitinophagaceae bacterium]
MTPTILTDKSRLQEIYDLRVAAWESSDRIGTINKLNFPNGWAENIDNEAFHFVIFDDKNKIVASARISLHNSIDELPYPTVFKEFHLPTDKPFAFYSRLVVSQENKSIFTFKKLDQIRIQFLRENNIPFALATCGSKRLKSMLAVGFEILGKTIIEFADIGQETALILFTNKVANGK